MEFFFLTADTFRDLMHNGFSFFPNLKTEESAENNMRQKGNIWIIVILIFLRV